ncbi:hypothetical protein EZS27_019443 [termite gut metagenome]|uniref:Uncharacterized protein n=1 Tax=termite gut metagenome TaxID=433724 RepID=A0A5J4RF97_9ZZZZ
MKRPWKIIVNILLGALLVNLLWFVAARTLQINVLPDPFTVYAHLGDVWQRSMSVHLLTSLWRMTIGIIIAALIGTVIAFGMVQSRIIGRLLGAFVYFAYPVPSWLCFLW